MKVSLKTRRLDLLSCCHRSGETRNLPQYPLIIPSTSLKFMKSFNSTRQWKHPEGYKYLAVWKNSVKLREMVRKFAETLPFSERRRKEHLNDAARSVQRNIEEGYKRPTTKEYLDFLGFSQGSLEEVRGDIRDCLRDNLITKELYDKFIEVINKTDYLFRRLVESLEKKMNKKPPFSAYQQWLKKRMEEEREDNRKFDEELKKLYKKDTP
jgi:four helix bundle protein